MKISTSAPLSPGPLSCADAFGRVGDHARARAQARAHGRDVGAVREPQPARADRGAPHHLRAQLVGEPRHSRQVGRQSRDAHHQVAALAGALVRPQPVVVLGAPVSVFGNAFSEFCELSYTESDFCVTSGSGDSDGAGA